MEPLDIKEVFHITVISHCINTVRVPDCLREIVHDFKKRRSGLFDLNQDVNNVLMKVRTIIPDVQLL